MANPGALPFTNTTWQKEKAAGANPSDLRQYLGSPYGTLFATFWCRHRQKCSTSSSSCRRHSSPASLLRITKQSRDCALCPFREEFRSEPWRFFLRQFEKFDNFVNQQYSRAPRLLFSLQASQSCPINLMRIKLLGGEFHATSSACSLSFDLSRIHHTWRGLGNRFGGGRGLTRV